VTYSFDNEGLLSLIMQEFWALISTESLCFLTCRYVYRGTKFPDLVGGYFYGVRSVPDL
jgi:hypothetical protein